MHMRSDRVLGDFAPRADSFMSEAASEGLGVIIIFVRPETKAHGTMVCTAANTSLPTCEHVAIVLEHEANRVRCEHEAKIPCERCGGLHHLGSG